MPGTEPGVVGRDARKRGESDTHEKKMGYGNKVSLKNCVGGVRGLTKLGVKKPIAKIVRVNEAVVPKAFKIPTTTTPSVASFEACVLRLESMPPLRLNDQLESIRLNIASGTISENLLRAFRVVEQSQRPRIEAALAQRDEARRAERAMPPALTDDEKKVEAGTHKWVCERQKCGGKGQQIAVWSVVKV